MQRRPEFATFFREDPLLRSSLWLATVLDAPDLAKAVADRYRVDREIGRGGMASVYLAHDIRHDRDVAIKVLYPELAAALGGERFLAEIKTTARLQHPHILPLLDSGDANGVLYYVMPYVSGETLRARLDREHLLPIEDALRIGCEVADALEHAHQLGIIHRDIKPENILLQNGHALVADFGIALAVQQAGGARMTQTGLSLGTPQYMEPEQAMGERTLDARADIYALAAVMYEMLIGDPPFTGSTVQSIVAKVMMEKPARIIPQREHVPPNVEAAIMRALEKLPADRWANVKAFVAALRDPNIGADADSVRTTDARAVGSSKRLPARLVAVGAVGLVAGLAIGLVASMLSGKRAAVDPAIVTSIMPPAGGNFGEQQALALSPDGRKLAFVFAAADGSHNLWVRDVGKLEATPIAGTSGADVPFWSYDGRSLGFFANGQLLVVDPKGDVRRLCASSGATGGSWNAAGLIAFSDRRGVSLVPAVGGACRRIISSDTLVTASVSFLPDGKRIAYSRGRTADIAVSDLDGKLVGTIPLQVLLFAVVAPDRLIYPDPKEIRSLDAQRIDFARLTLTGSPVPFVNDVRSRTGLHTYAVSANGALAYLPGSDDPPYLSYSANGIFDTIRVAGTWTLSVRPKRLGSSMIALAGNRVGIWLYDMKSGRATRAAIADTAWTSPAEGIGPTWPVFSPDGSRLAYTMGKRTFCGVAEHDLARGTDRVIVRTPRAVLFGCAAVQDWSSDGTRLIVRNDTAIHVMTLDGTVVSEIARPGYVLEGRFSPDGKSIAYSSDETGRAEVYLQSLSGGVPVRLSLQGGRWPQWTSDGKRIVFMTPGGVVQEALLNGVADGGTVRSLFAVQGWRRSTFDDHGVGFAMIGDEERYLVRQSPSGLAVAYVEHWPSLLSR